MLGATRSAPQKSLRNIQVLKMGLVGLSITLVHIPQIPGNAAQPMQLHILRKPNVSRHKKEPRGSGIELMLKLTPGVLLAGGL